ncbi:hypothetical protein J7J95_03265 [bacterium]|nr:hypothetical protein [bacterium]
MKGNRIFKIAGGILSAFSFLLAGVILVFWEGKLLTRISSSQRRENFALNADVKETRGSFSNFLYANLAKKEAPRWQAKVVFGDARPILIRQYLEYYHSPLLPYADFIFAVSQMYGLDYRLLVAIAQQESNLCKKIPPESHNCWGWGIHSRGTLKFSSYPEAIEAVARGLKEEYIDKGLTTPEQIMKKYTPLSNGSWAAGVRQFMEEIEQGPGR